ncbi:WAP four-disulfide core domain protein 8-like [Ranitomeya imitator]|uniref:WAP four-disulfide core domain protein 8-like n=1 Tax=Ranitomeya imitator TaxID=111125 RepID=UPI0037E77AB2
MSPVTSLVLLLTFSYLSSSVVLEYDSDPTVVKHGTYEGSTREKPGTCPLDVDYPTCNPTVDYVPECRTDKECKGPRKCCWSGCRKCCLLPLQPKLNPCPYFDHSICIRVRPLPAECHNDNQCQGTDRCCCANCRRQCTPTEKVKPGQCPAPKKKIIATSCTKDHDCIGDKKCCKEKGLKCVKPEQEHPGVCPISLEQLSCIYLNMTLCKRDSDCPPNKKCCLTEDNNLQCQKVKNEIPEKECPVVATLVRCEEPYAAPECHGDCDCRPGQRCCDVGCRMACRDL